MFDWKYCLQNNLFYHFWTGNSLKHEASINYTNRRFENREKNHECSGQVRVQTDSHKGATSPAEDYIFKCKFTSKNATVEKVLESPTEEMRVNDEYGYRRRCCEDQQFSKGLKPTTEFIIRNNKLDNRTNVSDDSKKCKKSDKYLKESIKLKIDKSEYG